MWNSSFYLGQDETEEIELILDFVIKEMQVLFLRECLKLYSISIKKKNRENNQI